MTYEIVQINFDVKCYRPIWAMGHSEPELRESFYRLYLDNELITERTWIWLNKTFLNESICVKLDQRFIHNLKLIPIIKFPDQAIFKLDNFSCRDKKIILKRISDKEINFNFK